MAKKLLKVKYRSEGEFFFDFYNEVEKYPDDLDIIESKEEFPVEEKRYRLYRIKYRDTESGLIEYTNIMIDTEKPEENTAVQ